MTGREVPASVEIFAAVRELEGREFTGVDVLERVGEDDVGRRTVYDTLAHLKAVGVVEEVREEGNAKVLRTVPTSSSAADDGREPEAASGPDAILSVRVPSTDGTAHGPDRMITWSWTDGRRTVTPTEHEEMERLLGEAEDRYGLDELASGDEVGRVWMDDDETVRRVEWAAEEGRQ